MAGSIECDTINFSEQCATLSAVGARGGCTGSHICPGRTGMGVASAAVSVVVSLADRSRAGRHVRDSRSHPLTSRAGNAADDGGHRRTKIGQLVMRRAGLVSSSYSQLTSTRAQRGAWAASLGCSDSAARKRVGELALGRVSGRRDVDRDRVPLAKDCLSSLWATGILMHLLDANGIADKSPASWASEERH